MTNVAHTRSIVLDEERETFTVRHRPEVVAMIDRLRNEKILTTVEFGDGHALVTTILTVRRDVDAMVFDIARDAELNRLLFAAPSLSFVTSVDQVEIAFDTGAASLVQLQDGPAALVELPAEVIRLQRREWFRVTLPLGNQIRCTVLDASGNASPARAVDLSCGGAGLLVDQPGAQLGQPGAGHELILSLPDVGRIELGATLRNVTTAPAEGDTAKIRAGFRFEALQPRTESQIQRFVNRIEVMRRRS